MEKPIINIEELEPMESPAPMPEEKKATYGGATMAFASRRIGAEKLGYSVVTIPAGKGKAAFPYHNHRVNEEAFFILEGDGEVRIGEGRYPIRKGDFIAHPAGGPASAHQITNASDEHPLVYLGISTQLSPEIAEYPDAGDKFGVLGQFPGADGAPERFMFLGRKGDQSVGYWD
ncbi:MAG TPA: cupin domain-containing protein [Candidatus Paceibacterota bacterium]|nr:cupin domain-containing protein [Candidatus Paceibacterota bacterium]